MPDDTVFERALKALVSAVARAMGLEDKDVTGVHVNRGESSDYTRGYNRGYDDRYLGLAYRGNTGAPPNEPWRTAYLNGYLEGWAESGKHEAEANDGS